MSTSQLLNKIQGNHEDLLDSLNELRVNGLLRRHERLHGRGRPQHIFEATTLGERFTQAYEELGRLRLRSNENDILSAVHQAELAKQVEEAGIPSYERFGEVMDLARNIANTAQNSPVTR